MSTLEKSRAVYDANLSEAEDIITGLLLPSMGLDTAGVRHKTKLTYRQWRWASHRYKEATRASQKLSQPYVERELDRAREDLESATELFPLGAEANELLALISLQGNDWPEAYRSYDAVASQSLPVSFYAQVNSVRDNKVVRATKVEIGADAIRLVYLSSYDPKKQVSLPPSKPAGEDDLGNLVVSAMQPPDPDAEAFTIRVADLMGIETDKNFVVLNLAGFLYDTGITNGPPFRGLLSPGPGIFGPATTDMTMDVDKEALSASQPLVDSMSTNLTTFSAHGGKLIFYHGDSDPWFSPLDTFEYYKNMAAANGSLDAVSKWSQFYFVPGMSHCGGGQALDQFDLLGAIVNWVEKGTTPTSVVATGKAFPGRSRPLCPDPKHAQYKGQGDAEDAANFECR